jgi:chromate transporter
MTTPFSLRRFSALVLRVANLTFGGGDPTMAALHRELIVSRGWLTNEQYGLIFGLARATPGTNMLAFCAGVGWRLGRWRGAIAAVLSASIPCAALVVWFTYGYSVLRSNPRAVAAIGGTLAAAVGMMWAAGYQLVRPRWKSGGRLRAAVVASAAFALFYAANMPPIQVLGLGALTGLVWQPKEKA